MILTARSNDLSDHNQDLLSFLGLQYNFSGPFLIFFWMQVRPLSQTIWLLKDLEINVYSS